MIPGGGGRDSFRDAGAAHKEAQPGRIEQPNKLRMGDGKKKPATWPLLFADRRGQWQPKQAIVYGGGYVMSNES